MSRALRRRRTGPALAGLFALGLLAGCSTASPPSPPSGVDGLRTPDVAPDPADFVDAVDNPWFPVRSGATARYQVDSASDPATEVLEVSAGPGPEIAGVATTRLTARDGADAALDHVDYFAQDHAGNVWWFGREGVWQVGEESAGAQLAMAATPRVGDGYRTVGLEGPEAVEIARVISTPDAIQSGDVPPEVDTPAGEFTELVVVDSRAEDGSGTQWRSFYAEGIGLVAREVVGGTPENELGLVAYDEPQ